MSNETLSARKIEIFFREKPISLAADLDSWLLSIKSKIGSRIFDSLDSDTDGLDRYIEFAEVTELPGAFMACAFYQSDINEALTRAGLFMGAGKGLRAGTVTKQSEYALLNYKKLVAGHNLPGPVLCGFFKAVTASHESSEELNSAEQAVADSFVNSNRIKQLKEAFYLIGFSIQTTKDQKGVISHEIFHAQSFLNPTFKKTVSDFWRDVVTADDRKAITEQIGSAYNVDDEDLVIDEFQAYLIQTRAESDRMKDFVPKYRNLLLDKLRQATVKPLQI